MWRMDDENAEGRHTLVVVIGFCLLLAAAFIFYLGTGREQWLPAKARVQTVEVRCEMHDSGRYRRPTQRVIIGCDQVERFRADNAGRGWYLSRKYSGEVLVTRGGESVVVDMELGRVGSPPRVGDYFDLVQDPTSPGSVSFPDRSLSEKMTAGSLAGLGIFVLALAFFWI